MTSKISAVARRRLATSKPFLRKNTSKEAITADVALSIPPGFDLASGAELIMSRPAGL
jgi:hypothetical protein